MNGAQSVGGRTWSVGLDVLALAALVALVAWYAATFLDFSLHPEEDAAMLLRYSRHLAQGQGVVWNVGEPPLDGATDLLFMAVVAVAHRAGVGLEGAARALGLAAHTLTVLVVYGSIRTLFRAHPAVALMPATYLAIGPGPRYVTACYGTTVFALAIAIGWHLAWRVVRSEPGQVHRRAAALGLCAVVMGAARPEGALLGVVFVAGVLVGRGGAQTGAVVRGFATGFVLPGLAYFVWRWSYFGAPLPNPFYRKSGGALHWDVLARSCRNVFRLGGPFLPVLLAGLVRRRSRRAALAALVPITGFTLMWVLVSDETNYFMRFRYPILPVILVGWVPVAQALIGAVSWPAPRRRWVAGAWLGGVALAVALALWQHRRFAFIEPQRMGLYDVAMMLRPYAARGYTLATTEAGLLPLYSQWRAVDAWGLNDRWIAHHGGVSEPYLDRYRPELIVFHAYFSPVATPDETGAEGRGLGRPWLEMVTTLQRYAERRRYVLAAAFARDPADAHYYYVRQDFPDRARLTEAIRGMRYLWNGHPAQDYAAGAR